MSRCLLKCTKQKNQMRENSIFMNFLLVGLRCEQDQVWDKPKLIDASRLKIKQKSGVFTFSRAIGKVINASSDPQSSKNNNRKHSNLFVFLFNLQMELIRRVGNVVDVQAALTIYRQWNWMNEWKGFVNVSRYSAHMARRYFVNARIVSLRMLTLLVLSFNGIVETFPSPKN